MAVKPQRIQAKQVFAYVNSTPTRRVQSFDWASNFTIDSVFELGNAGIVEDSVTLVETGITVNSNEWGTTDLEAMMFGIYQQRNIRGDDSDSLNIANTIGSIYVAARGSGGSWSGTSPAVATNDYLQVIRVASQATTNSAEFVKVLTSRYVGGATACNVYGVQTLGAAAATGDIVTLVNKYTITQDTVDSDPVHFVLPHRRSSSATTMLHSVALPRCFVDNLTYRIDTGGASEQNYTLVGEEERLLLGSRRELQTVPGSFMSYATDTVVFRIPEDSLSVTGSPYITYAASNLATLSKITYTSPQVTVSVEIGSSLGIDSSTQIVYYYTNKTKRGYKALTNIDGAIGKLTKGFAEIYLKVGSGSQEKLTRVTGLDITNPLPRESIDELGESRTIGKPLEGNIRNELTLTFNRNDLREYAKLLGTETAFDADTLTEILMTDMKSITNVQIVVKLYSSQTLRDATTLLKTMTFDSCTFIGDNSTTPISGAGVLELQFSTQSINYVGSGLRPVFD